MAVHVTGSRGEMSSWMETQSAVLMQGWKRLCLHRGFGRGGCQIAGLVGGTAENG